jgi:hypothetical protein
VDICHPFCVDGAPFLAVVVPSPSSCLTHSLSHSLSHSSCPCCVHVHGPGLLKVACLVVGACPLLPHANGGQGTEVDADAYTSFHGHCHYRRCGLDGAACLLNDCVHIHPPEKRRRARTTSRRATPGSIVPCPHPSDRISHLVMVAIPYYSTRSKWTSCEGVASYSPITILLPFPSRWRPQTEHH